MNLWTLEKCVSLLELPVMMPESRVFLKHKFEALKTFMLWNYTFFNHLINTSQFALIVIDRSTRRLNDRIRSFTVLSWYCKTFVDDAHALFRDSDYIYNEKKKKKLDQVYLFLLL
jgi:hypothetical protein